MKLSNLLKRTGAFVLSIAMMSAVIDGFVSEPVRAAVGDRVVFKEQIADDKYTENFNTYVVAGYDVEVITDLPNYANKWSYENPPFGYYKTGAPPDGKSLNIKGTPQRISVEKILQDEGGTDELGYTVMPNLRLQMTSGFGEFTYRDSGIDKKESLTVTSDEGLGITEPSSITFQTIQGHVDNNITFGDVLTATGVWENIYGGANIRAEDLSTSGLTFKLYVTTPDNRNRMIFNIKSAMKIPAGAKFTITYMPDKMPELTLTAVKPETAITNVLQTQSSPANPTQTGEKMPFIQFSNQTDNLFAVSSSFMLLNEFYKYNAPMDIEWKLKNYDADKDYVKLLPQRGKKQIVAQVNSSISADDHEVVLIGEVGFRDGGAASTTPRQPIEIRVVIQGSGSRPKVTIDKRYNAINVNNEQEIIEAPANNIFPTQMEVYDGIKYHAAPENSQRAFPPYKVKTTLSFGKSQGRATHAMVSVMPGSSGQLRFSKDAENTTRLLTTQGIKVDNIIASPMEQETLAYFYGEKAGSVALKIEYFNGPSSVQAFIYNIEVLDHSPNSDASLKSLDAKVTIDSGIASPDQLEAFKQTYPDGKLEYGFTSTEKTYNITVPDVVHSISLRPIYNVLSPYVGVDQDVSVSVTPQPGSPIPPIKDNNFSREIELIRGSTTKIVLNARAEDGTRESYTLNILRSSQGIDNSLKDIVVNQTNPEKTNVPLLPIFNPTIYDYSITVPYSVEELNVKAIANDTWATKPKIESDGPEANFFLRMFENASNKVVKLRYDVIDQETQQVNNVTIVKVTVTPENQSVNPQVYTIRITRSPPDNNSDLSSLRLLRNREGEEVKLDGKGFDKNQRIFYATVPYSTDLLRLELLPDSKLAQQVRVEPSVGKGKTLKYVNKDNPLAFTFSGLGQGATPDPALNEITFNIWVMAESGNETDPPYQLIVTRAPPDNDTGLTSITVLNEADNKAVPGFTFIPTKREYSFSVDYTVEAVIVEAKAKSKLSKVYIDGKLVNDNVPSRTVKLAAGGVTTITVRIVPESGEANAGTYVLNITRTTPNNEARLINLVVNGGTDQKPTPFVPATTSYSWSIPEGTKDYTVTATAVDPKATITVNGKAAPNGGASEKIMSTEANSTVLVVVTAEDGKTTKTYTLKISNYNYMKKSNNADLSSLKLNHGQLAPAFNPTVLEFEVYVKPTAMSLAIMPRPANPKAKVEVKHGNRVLSEFDGAYTSSILEDETVFTILVTAEDGVATKTYTLNVYRNDEEKSGIFAPVTPDMVDFETSNPIIIDIATYPVVDAQIFNTLKTEYPDKTILFKGTDYTLELKGSDMDTLVPHTATFDLSFSFTTPEKTAIENLLYDMGSQNDRLEPVYVHFDHHGTLPAPMLLTVSLGKEYSNDTVYWNYYNKERDRIDYYGYVNTNAKGTFSVPIDHFSTYLITIMRVWGAENKSGLDYSSTPWLEEIGVETPTQKVNPNTGRVGATSPNAGGTR